MLLVGDIGGTKTNLAIFSPAAGPRAPLAEATFPSDDYPSLEAITRKFLTQTDWEVERASFGVAGPVVAGRATITNLPWVIDEIKLQETLNLPSGTVRLLNDLEAIAHAVPFLEPDDLHTLNEGPYPWFLKQRILSDNGHLSNVDAGEALSSLAGDRTRHIVALHLSDTNNSAALARSALGAAIERSGCGAGLTVFAQGQAPTCVRCG